MKRLHGALLLVVFLGISFGGCLGDYIGDESCPRSTSDRLRMNAGIRELTDFRLVRWFGCEAVEKEWPVDRYAFVFALPDAEPLEVLLEPNGLSPADNGSATRVVPVQQGAASQYLVRFAGWDTSAHHGSPTIGITWDRGGDSEVDPLPGGFYNITVALRSDPSEAFPTSYCLC